MTDATLSRIFDLSSNFMVLCGFATIGLWLVRFVLPTFIKQFKKKEFVLKHAFLNQKMNYSLALVASAWFLGWLFIGLATTCHGSNYDPRDVCQDIAHYKYQASRVGYWMSSIHYAGNLLACLAWCTVAAGIVYALYRFGKVVARYVVAPFLKWVRTFKVRWE